MCRLALFNYKGFKYLEKMGGLDTFFQELEISQGGHGNGVALLYPDGRIELRKGVGFDTNEAADFVRNVGRFSWCLFHTRVASAGTVKDENCHPFREGDLVLAANGTEFGFQSLGKVLGDITDTEALFRALIKLEAPIPFSLIYFESVFMGFADRRPFVVSAGWSGDLEVFAYNGIKIFASELPADWKGVLERSPKKAFYWHGGRVLVKDLVKRTGVKARYRYYYGYYDKWLYDDEEDYSLYGLTGGKKEGSKKDETITVITTVGNTKR